MSDCTQAFYHQKAWDDSCEGQDRNGPHASQAQVPLVGNCVAWMKYLFFPQVFEVQTRSCKWISKESCLTTAEKNKSAAKCGGSSSVSQLWEQRCVTNSCGEVDLAARWQKE